MGACYSTLLRAGRRNSLDEGGVEPVNTSFTTSRGMQLGDVGSSGGNQRNRRSLLYPSLDELRSVDFPGSNTGYSESVQELVKLS